MWSISVLLVITLCLQCFRWIVVINSHTIPVGLCVCWTLVSSSSILWFGVFIYIQWHLPQVFWNRLWCPLYVAKVCLISSFPFMYNCTPIVSLCVFHYIYIYVMDIHVIQVVDVFDQDTKEGVFICYICCHKSAYA